MPNTIHVTNAADDKYRNLFNGRISIHNGLIVGTIVVVLIFILYTIGIILNVLNGLITEQVFILSIFHSILFFEVFVTLLLLAIKFGQFRKLDNFDIPACEGVRRFIVSVCCGGGIIVGFTLVGVIVGGIIVMFVGFESNVTPGIIFFTTYMLTILYTCFLGLAVVCGGAFLGG